MMGAQHHASPKTNPLSSANLLGILYAEDFDNPEHQASSAREREAEPPIPVITQADIDAACAAAVRSAKADWQRSNDQRRLDAIATLGAVLGGIQDAAERSALAVAEATVTTILSIVTGLLPHFSREHGAAEVRALLSRLLPTIRSQIRINVRVHPDLVALMQRDVAELEPALAALIDINPAQLDQGDVKVSWENGSMTRDTRTIMQAIGDALGELGLQQPVETPTKKRMAYAE